MLLKSLVVNGVGIRTALSMILDLEDELVAVPFDPPIPLHIGLGWKKSHYLSKASRAFLEFMQQQLQGQPQRGDDDHRLNQPSPLKARAEM